MNRVTISGYLTQDVSMRKSPSGKSIASFTVAVYKKPRNADEKDAIFLPVVFWNKTAELCNQYCRKGSRVAVDGKLNIRDYSDTEGIKRYVTEIIGDKIEFLDKPKNMAQERGRDIPPPEQELDEQEL